MVHLSLGRYAARAMILFAAATGPVTAATIYGSVSENQQPAGNRPIELVCPGQNPVAGTTDARGSYRFTVGMEGRCVVRMGAAGATVAAPVILSVNPAQYNFDLRNVGGHPTLVQR